MARTPAACPACKTTHTHVISCSLLHNGTRYRRHHCHDCDHRWRSYDGPQPPHRRGSTAARGHGICPEEVQEMLTNRTLNHNQMAAKLDLHKATVRNVRLGHILSHVHPELPRWAMAQRPTRTCERCEHWNGCCSLGYPDPTVEGPTFAADCDMFEAA